MLLRRPARWLLLVSIVCTACAVSLLPVLASNPRQGDEPPDAGAQAVWPQVKLVPVASGFQRLTQVTHAGDGSHRLFAVEQAGRILVVAGAGAPPRTFLDIRDRVRCCEGERGLFSLAFPPDYAGTGYFYVAYSALDAALILARYRVSADPDRADAGTETVVLRVPHPNATHYGGQLAFSPRDGYLYLSLGDGGTPGDPQRRAPDPSQLFGKILRLDVGDPDAAPYAIPASNPRANLPVERDEIWASGLRNPWRFSFDRITGDLYVGDVGEEQFEEIDFQPAASIGQQNYGWPAMEGLHCYQRATCDMAQLTLPIWEYDHAGSACSAVIGGYVYRGRRYGSLFGIYFYGDYCRGTLWGLQYVGDQWQNKDLAQLGAFSVTSFGEDDAGELYVTDQAAGQIYQVTDGRS